MSLRLTAYVALVGVLLVGRAALCTQASSSTPAGPKLFEFHSGFWINLHHFLYREAQVTSGKRLTLTGDDADELRKLSPEERATWDAAVAYYKASIIDRDLLFDEGLIQIKNSLEDGEDSADLASVSVPAELKMVLLKAAPIYRKYWWARHDRDNRRWIATLEALVSEYGVGISADLVRIYSEPWPGNPVRVDAVGYANWAGAYTTVPPTRPTIATTDAANQGTAALEIVFHETSHGMMDKVVDAIRTAEARLNAPSRAAKFDSGQLWHAVLFYTTGELVAERVAGCIPYADKNGLWSRAWKQSDRLLIEQDWKPHMNGSVTLEDAIGKLIADEAAQRQKAP